MTALVDRALSEVAVHRCPGPTATGLAYPLAWLLAKAFTRGHGDLDANIDLDALIDARPLRPRGSGSAAVSQALTRYE